MTQPPNPADYPPPGGYPPAPDQGGFTPAPGGYPPPPPQGSYPPPPGWGGPPQGSYPPPQGSYPPPPGWGAPPQGSYPPPPGAYPPAPGSYPPPGGYYPPPGSYPPPPSADGGYAPPPPGYGRPAFSVGDAFSWAWNKFSKNAIPLILATLIFGAILFGVLGLFILLVNIVSPETFTAYETADGITEFVTPGDSVGGTAVTMAGWIVGFVIAGAIASAFYGGLLDIADGRPVTLGSFFRPRKVASVVVSALIIGIVSALVTFPLQYVPYVGGLIASLISAVVSIFTVFTTVAIVDRGLSPVEGIRHSVGIARSHSGESVLVWLVSTLLLFIGALFCLAGLLVTAPLALLFVVYSYRKLAGATVAPATV